MASGFHYSCSQFLSALQFTSLSSQVQEVARQLRDPSVSSEDVASLSDATPPSRPSPSHALKLFLSGCQSTEFGAVESSCWGLRRLHETDLVATQELISQLQTKLTTCPHPTPLVSLLADLLLSEHSHPEYNLHTHQHPLALAFSHCPDSVTCAISSLLTAQHAQPALHMLWPCLLHPLIDPRLSRHRTSLTSTLLEVASAPSSSGLIATALLRLLILSVVCSDDADHILLALLDFSLSCPTLSPLSDVISSSLNFLLHCSVHTTCSLLLHKLKRLFTSQPDVLFNISIIPWLALSLLSPFLTPLATQLTDIAELVVKTYQQDSVPAASRDSLSLLLLPLLSAQLGLQRIRPDIASRYSLLLQSLLSAPRRSQRGSGTIEQVQSASSISCDAGVYQGDLCLFSFLSRFLLLCHISLLTAWCEDTIVFLSQATVDYESPPLLSCIASSLLTEFTSDSSTSASSSTRAIQQLLRLISLLVRSTPSLSPPLIACLMIAMDRCPYPELAALTLHTLSSLSTHPACVLLLLRSLLSLSDTPALLPPLLRALVSLWKRHDAVFPHLKQLIHFCTPSSLDWSLARSLSILDVCRDRAAVHGEEMLPLVSDLVECRDPLFACIGLSALVSLVEAGATEYTHALRLLFASVGSGSPAHWEAHIARRAAQLFSLSHTQLEFARDQELLCKCVQQQLALLAHSDELVQAAALSALSETSPRDIVLLEPFSPSLRALLSLPDSLDLSPDRRSRNQCAALCSFILRIDFTPRSEFEGSSALSRLLSYWLDDELSSSSSVFPREHKQEAEKGEAALRSTAKLLTSHLPKLTHRTDISDLSLSPHQAVSILFLGRELWGSSPAPENLCQQYLQLFSRSLLFSPIPPTSALTPSDINSFLVFIHGLQLFMSDVISSTTLPSPVASLFPILDRLTCSRNPQGVMWLLIGLALNVRELHSSGLQSSIQALINSLISASTHLFPSTDSYAPLPAAQTLSFSQDLSAVNEVAYLGLGVLGGVMVAHLKQNFSANTLNLYIRAWNSPQHSSHQLDILYALTLSSILQTKDTYLLEEGPSSRKLAELCKRCTQQIQEARYPGQFAYILLRDDVTLIRRKQQESLETLTAQEFPRAQPFEIAAMNCSVLTCRLYSHREISLQQCDQIISTFLKLSSQAAPDSCLHSAAGILLSRTATSGHVAAQLLIHKYLSQLRSLLQTSPDQFESISPLLLGIFALFGAYQPIFGNQAHPCPPTPSHYSVLQQGVRTLMDYISPKIDKKNLFSHSLSLLGFIYRRYSLFSETIRTPSSSARLPDNIILTPLFSFIEQSLFSGNIHHGFQRLKFETIFNVLSSKRNRLLSYPWANLITCFQRSSEHDGLHSSLLKLLFRIQSQATEQEHQQIRYILHCWVLDPAICPDRIGVKSRKVVTDNISCLFDSSADPLALKPLLLTLLQDPQLFVSILKGLIIMLTEHDTEVVRAFKRTLLITSLEYMLSSPSSYLYKPEFIHLFDECLSKLMPKDIERLLPQEGEAFLLLRVHLFIHSYEYIWLRPCITYLLDQPPLTRISLSPLSDILLQLSIIRTLPISRCSQVCLEVLNVAKSALQNRTDSVPTTTLEKHSTLVFNTLYILCLISPEMSRISGPLFFSHLKLLPNNTPLDSDLSLCLSNVTHATIAINTSKHETQNSHTPIVKKLYEFLLLFTQLLDSCDESDSFLISTTFSFLTRIRQMDSVIASKPWALFGQAILIQSRLLLK